jgi:hypothetical protein
MGHSKLTVHFRGFTLCAGCVAGVTDSEAELSSISTEGASGASEGERELSGPDAAESFVSVLSSVAPVAPSGCPFVCNENVSRRGLEHSKMLMNSD